jgi:cysteine desulfurase
VQSATDRIYLDNAATTRIDPQVLEAMRPWLEEGFGNAATLYSPGREAAAAVEEARERVAQLLNAASDREIVFTSCATESDNWVVLSSVLGRKPGRDRPHLVVSAIEHHAVLEPCHALRKAGLADLTEVPVDAEGRVSPEAFAEALRPETVLASVMYANNETGTLQPVAELARIARDAGVPFHTDAVQCVGKMPLDVQALGVDFLSLSAHKFHGPKGVGVLSLRRGAKLAPLLRGGGQEENRRAGTTNVAGIVGLGKAAELSRTVDDETVAAERALVETLWSGLEARIPKIRRNGHAEERLSGILNVTLEGVEGEAMLLMLDLQGICVSSGSACTTGSLDPSHVLLALGLPAEVAHGSLRFSLSRETTGAEIERVLEVLPGIVERLREMSPTWEG